MHTLFRAALLFIAAGAAFADEGMWTYDNFPAAKMRATYGWAPDAAWLEHARLGSIRLTLGCSASLVSPNGLVMTNHHCARACVSDLADAQHDYVATGFFAATAADEKKCPAMEANQLVSITDVTRQIESATAGKSDRAFHEAERAAKAQIESACGTASNVRCQVVTLYAGGVYDLYKYKRYQDLRVVFVPEESVAFFGGDPDNFTFPRYDLDAAFVRIYDNGKALRTDTYLKFAAKGVRQGDIAFTSGNPGSTERDDTLAELEFERDAAQPFVLSLFSELRGILTEFATKGPEQARTSKTLLFSIENSLKAIKGRQLALVEGTLVADKARAENEFRKRVAADPALAANYGAAWDAVAAAVAHQRTLYVRSALLERYPQRLSALMGHAIALNRYAAEVDKPDGQRLEEYSDANFPALRQEIVSPAPIHAEFEKTVLTWWLTKVREYLGTSDPDVRALLGTQSPEEVANALTAGTKLGDAPLRAQLLNGGAAAIGAYHDPLVDFARVLDVPARAVRADYENTVKAVKTKNASLIAKAHFALVGKDTYPDATFTLRLSYGEVGGYRENGRSVPPTTNFAGAYAHATGRDPFKLPASWVMAEKAVDPNALLNFVSTDDIIGGNSGSPVIGRNGEVIGLIFDGNIQSLGGDFGYDGAMNRAVAVDVSGITEALKNIYHADRLVKELTH
ncbi:MAG TPA: S46 family peptidase [Steroidobacteraceae bacterium]|nr:S46 family peptidase [Steroidobacteraceae bacterium]